jgi:hypothetical protein
MNSSIKYSLILYSFEFQKEELIWTGYNQTDYFWDYNSFNFIYNYTLILRLSINETTGNDRIIGTVYSDAIVNIDRGIKLNANTERIILDNEITIIIMELFDDFQTPFNYSITLIKGEKNNPILNNSYTLFTQTNSTTYNLDLTQFNLQQSGIYILNVFGNYGEVFQLQRSFIILIMSPTELIIFSTICIGSSLIIIQMVKTHKKKKKLIQFTLKKVEILD